MRWSLCETLLEGQEIGHASREISNTIVLQKEYFSKMTPHSIIITDQHMNSQRSAAACTGPV